MMLNLDNLPKKGENVTFVLRGARFDMTIQEARIRYGDIDVRISPVSGTGSFWVRYASVKKNSSVESLTPEQEDSLIKEQYPESSLVG
jgi:hypothetical protein